jgi:putative transposase
MRQDIPNSPNHGSTSFQKIADVFLAQDGLPFSNILTSEQIERAFARNNGLFGQHGVYSTPIVLWAFLSQVLKDGKEAACQAAVARIASHCLHEGIQPPTHDTGDYCKARAKLSETALHELGKEVADELQQRADESWLWKNRHAKLIDGFTFTMPDTPKNMAEFPHPRTQKKGVGLPIARAVAILSLATACIMDVAIGPYKGKETGETALLRSILSSLYAGDIAVFDRYYCSFMMIALLQLQGTDVCARLHQKRTSDFRTGERLGKGDHLIVWTRPARPDWMDQETYDRIPETLELRELRYAVVEKGRRTKMITVVTTLTDATVYSTEDIAELYSFRWNSELDIRAIKSSLNLAHVRCKSPEMVRRELRTTLLAYNLVRTTAANAASLHGRQPRQISFTGTCQYVLSSWQLISCGTLTADQFREHCLGLLAQIAACEVANRPGRLEPRVLKRRRHGYPLMQKPRSVLRQELQKHCT